MWLTDNATLTPPDKGFYYTTQQGKRQKVDHELPTSSGIGLTFKDSCAGTALHLPPAEGETSRQRKSQHLRLAAFENVLFSAVASKTAP